jgi:outer membrane protein assembly factor BamB
VPLPFKKLILIPLMTGYFIPALAEIEKRLITHGKARELKESFKSFDWSRFNGPLDNATTYEGPLSLNFDDNSLKKIWESSKGEGYASPAVTKDRLILFHLDAGQEIIEALNPETGHPIWSYSYPANYRDRYGYSNGPRASPVIWKNRVFAHGVTAWLTCLDLITGDLIWKRDLKKEFKIPDYFFGKGSNPIVVHDTLLLNTGGEKGESVVGFDLGTGETKWITRDKWGASYSSPFRTFMHGREVCLFLTGGESRPPTGGLLVVDPTNGKKLSRFSWRSSNYESANASPPIPISNNQVFISECYEKGAALISFDSEFKTKVIWENPALNIHWMTPVLVGKYIYGVSGRHQRGAEVFCVEAQTGKVQWKEKVSWVQTVMGKTLDLELFRGSLLKTKDHFIGLSELGSLVVMDLSPEGWKIHGTKQLFFAPGTWTLPAISHGLLFIMQNETDRMSGKKPRIICYDLRP